jgi:hypothetical protein
MSRLSISTAWDQTRAILARDGRLFAAVALALIVLPELIMAVVGSPVAADATPASRLVYMAVILLGIVAQIALNRLAIGPGVTVSEAIATGFVRLIPVFAVLLVAVIAIAVLAGLISMVLGAAGITLIKSPQEPTAGVILLLIVLVLFVFAVTQLVFPLAAAETANPIRLASRSWQLARGHYLRLLGFVVIALLGAGVIVIATQAGLGSLIVLLFGRPNPGSMSALLLGLIAGLLQGAFTVVTAVMLARIYVQLSGRGEAQASVPSSGV